MTANKSKKKKYRELSIEGTIVLNSVVTDLEASDSDIVKCSDSVIEIQEVAGVGKRPKVYHLPVDSRRVELILKLLGFI
jgi:hypothetical protein